MSVKAIFKPAALTGTASITGTLKYGEELTASLTGTNNTGNLDYTWYQNGTTQIAANNTGKYTLRRGRHRQDHHREDHQQCSDRRDRQLGYRNH